MKKQEKEERMNKGISILYYESGRQQEDEKTKNLIKGQSCGEMLQVVCAADGEDPAQAYNRFLKEADRELLTVVNGGDVFETDYFEGILKAYEDAGEEISFFMSNKNYYFNGVKRKRPFLPGNLPEDRTVIDIWEQENGAVIPTFLNGTFLKTSIAAQFQMKPELGLEAEKEMLLRMTLDHKKVLYIQNLMYVYDTPRDAHPYIYYGVYMREWYYNSFSEFLLPFLAEVEQRFGEVPRYLQYAAAHYIVCRLAANIDNKNKRVVEEDGETYLRSFHGVLQYVGYDVLANVYGCPTYTSNLDLRLLLARLKMDETHPRYEYALENNKVTGMLMGVPFFTTANLAVGIQLIDYRDGKWEIDCRLKSFFPLEDSRYYVTLGEKEYDLRFEERFSHTMIFGCTISRYHTFHVSVPLDLNAERQELAFWIQINDQKIKLKTGLDFNYSRIPHKFKYGYWRFDRFLAYRSGKDLVIRKAGKLYTAYRELRIWKELLMRRKKADRYYAGIRMLYFLTRPWFRRKKIWLFQDKIYKGGDSSEYLYRYSMKQKDGIEKYYLLDENAPDYERLKKEGYRPLKRNSLKHKLVFLNADMLVASNSAVFVFNGYGGKKTGYVSDLFDFHVVCVQHGLSVQNIARAQYRLKDNTRLYFCASKYEIENLSRPIYNYNGYDALKLTGVPRYDGLVDEEKKQILLSPTWRMQSAMMGTKNESVVRQYNPYFKETDYYRIYNSLINDQRLIEAAKEYGYRIVYVLHPIVSPQAEDFDKNDYVDIVPAVGDMSYEKMFRESSLMVTDFSGVQFDFAYMRKPLVYLHHKDIPKHYEEGIFTYDTMAFGEICQTNEELVDVLCEYMKDGCRMKDVYRKRADDFFAFRDHDNCRRIYDVMLEYQRNVIGR